MRKDKLLDKEDTDLMRAIAIICIILHHIYNEYEITWLTPFKYVGFLFVGLFFCLSGYGLYTSLVYKNNYISKIPNKLSKLVINFFMALVIYYLVHRLIGIQDNNIFNVVRNSWYLYQILIIYVIFYISFKFFERKLGKKIVLLFIIIILLMEYFSGFNETWYKSSLTFVLGLFLVDIQKILNEYIYDKFTLLVEIVALFVLLILGSMTQLGIMDILIYNISTILFTIVFIKLFYILKLYKINNKILKHIGNISLELYLYHGLAIEIITKISSYKNINVILIFCLSYILALLIKKVNLVTIENKKKYLLEKK